MFECLLGCVLLVWGLLVFVELCWLNYELKCCGKGVVVREGSRCDVLCVGGVRRRC